MSTNTDISPANAASPAQLRFINSLFEQVRPKSDSPGVADVVKPVHDLLVLAMASVADPSKPVEITKSDATRIIDALKGAAAIVPATTIKWKKLGNDWFIHGDAALLVPGAVVTVTSSKGEKQVTVEQVASTDGLNVFATVVDERKQAQANVPHGIHRNADGVLLKVKATRSGQTVAYRIVQGVKGGEYLGKRGLTGLSADTLLSEDDARRYGYTTGHCCNCGEVIENSRSMVAGYGPVCARNNGWWYPSQKLADALWAEYLDSNDRDALCDSIEAAKA